MSPFFGKKKGSSNTVAILDIENGSVGAALAHLSHNAAPKLFAETRIALPLLHTRDASVLASHVERAAGEALQHVSEVASRLRGHEQLSKAGEVGRVAVFLSVPWAAMHLEGGTGDYDPYIAQTMRSLTQATFGDQKTSLHPFGTAAAHGAVRLFPFEEPTMLCIVSGEMAEILVIDEERLVARATVPLGLHTLLRTLVAHGGASPEEARSWLSLATRTSHPTLHEALSSAGRDFAEQFADVAKPLLATSAARHVLVVAPEPAEEWFARTLAEAEALHELFPEGSTVGSMRPMHARSFLAAHAPKPDLPLMLEALFVDSKYGV